MLKYIITLAMTLLITLPVQAAIFWDDEMEAGTIGFDASDLAAWIASGAYTYDTSIKFSGTGSLRMNYPAACQPVEFGGSGCGGAALRSFTPTADVYRRFYYRISGTGANATPSGLFEASMSAFTKVVRTVSSGLPRTWWSIGCCSKSGKMLVVSLENSPPIPVQSATNFYTSRTLADNVWYCIETREKLNTPGVADGIQQAWVDGVQVGLKTDYFTRGVGDNSLWTAFGVFRQTARGNSWFDRYAAGDTRIGCIGTPQPGDTTAPTVPGAMQATPGQGTVTVTHAASNDQSSPITYITERATGLGSTVFTPVNSSTVLSFTDTGLAPSTLYRYRTFARDINGLTSGASAIVEGTTFAAPAANALTITSNGRFAINGVSTFLLGVSYFDALRYRTSDIDTLAARGFNNIRIFTDFDDDDLDPGDTSVCNANGTLRSTETATINALIDYAETKGMTVTIVVLNAHSDSWMTTQAARLDCVTNTMNAFEAQPLVLFDIVQEHDYSFTGVGDAGDLDATEVKLYNDQARAACATCIIFSSLGAPMSHPADSTATIVPSAILAKVNNGENVIAIHDYRSSNWWSITGSRVAAYRNYLDSIGRQNVPVIFDEPNRHGFTYASTEAQFNQAARDAKNAGAAMWVFHHGASFEMLASSMFAQLNATETAITLSMANALVSPSGDVPVSLATEDFAAIGDWTGGYTGHQTPVLSSGRLRAFSTGTESLMAYTGTTTPNNQGATVEIATGSAVDVMEGRIALRMSTSPTVGQFECRFSRNSTPRSAIVVKTGTLSPITLTSRNDITWSAGEVPGCFVYGTTIYMTKGSVTGTPILTAENTTYSSGRAGLYMREPTDTANFELDNFILYEFGAPPPPCTPSITGFTTTATGASGVTWSAGCIPTNIRHWTGGNLGISTDGLYALSSFPGGVFTLPGGFPPGTTFQCIAAADSLNVVNLTPSEYLCAAASAPTTADTTAPVMSAGLPSTILPVGTTSHEISFSVDEPSICRYAASNIAFDAMTLPMAYANGKCSATVSGLTNGSSTPYYGQAADIDDLSEPRNKTTTAIVMTVEVDTVTADTVRPRDVTGVVATPLSSSQVLLQANATFDSDDVTPVVAYHWYLCTLADCSTKSLADTTAVPFTTIGGLAQNSNVSFVSIAEDASGNLSLNDSNIASATTTAVTDIDPPSSASDLTLVKAYRNSSAITWKPGSDTQGEAKSIVQIALGPACDSYESKKSVTSNALLIRDLVKTTQYCARIVMEDSKGNLSGPSNSISFTTTTYGISEPRIDSGTSRIVRPNTTAPDRIQRPLPPGN